MEYLVFMEKVTGKYTSSYVNGFDNSNKRVFLFMVIFRDHKYEI